MSDETIPVAAESPFWKRSANVLTVLALILTLGTPVLGWVWSASSRLDRTEQRVEAAKLPEEHDRLLKIERDVEWIRKALEAKNKGE